MENKVLTIFCSQSVLAYPRLRCAAPQLCSTRLEPHLSPAAIAPIRAVTYDKDTVPSRVTRHVPVFCICNPPRRKLLHVQLFVSNELLRSIRYGTQTTFRAATAIINADMSPHPTPATTFLPLTASGSQVLSGTLKSLKNSVFWDIKTQFVLHRRHVTSPLQSPAS
jgi:hypothetical protein